MAKPDFVQGIYCEPSNKDFVKVKMRMSVDRFQKFLEEPTVKEFYNKNNGYLNMDILESKNGKFYMPFSEFIPEKKVTSTDHNPDRDLDEVPF
tara:strand:+ start:251 stop:529 length:279 start_codon:yes stop_codon:yes gene_type:complete